MAEIYRPMAEGLTNPYLKDAAIDILDKTLAVANDSGLVPVPIVDGPASNVG